MNTKSKIKAEIPCELRDAFRDVLDIIEEAERDPDYSIDYGDAIQVPPTLVGGRVGNSERPFEFSFRSADGHLWSLQLSQLEIEDIVDAMMTSINLYVCETCNKDYFTSDADYECKCDHKSHGFGNFEFPAAHKKLEQLDIDAITESSTRDQVIELLGDPFETGGNVESPTIGYIAPWIKYHRDDCQLRFEFGKNGKLRMVSLLEPNWQPGR